MKSISQQEYIVYFNGKMIISALLYSQEVNHQNQKNGNHIEIRNE